MWTTALPRLNIIWPCESWEYRRAKRHFQPWEAITLPPSRGRCFSLSLSLVPICGYTRAILQGERVGGLASMCGEQYTCVCMIMPSEWTHMCVRGAADESECIVYRKRDVYVRLGGNEEKERKRESKRERDIVSCRDGSSNQCREMEHDRRRENEGPTRERVWLYLRVSKVGSVLYTRRKTGGSRAQRPRGHGRVARPANRTTRKKLYIIIYLFSPRYFYF